MVKNLKQLRNNIIINKFIRYFIKFLIIKLPQYLKENIIPRWRAKGKIKLRFKDIDFFYYSNCDDRIVEAIFYEDYEEKNELNLFKEFSKISSNILDIGGNTGIYSIISALANPNCKIIAFEPYFVNAKRFKFNLKINKINNVKIIEKAVGDSFKKIYFTVPENDQICDVISANSLFTRKFNQKFINYKEIELEQISIDEYLKSNKINNIDLIKIDVETYEEFVLKGCSSLLKNENPIIFCEMFVDDKKIGFYNNFLQPLGYIPYGIFKDGILRLENLMPNENCKNFIFSKNITSKKFISYNNIDDIIDQLKYS